MYFNDAISSIFIGCLRLKSAVKCVTLVELTCNFVFFSPLKSQAKIVFIVNFNVELLLSVTLTKTSPATCDSNLV